MTSTDIASLKTNAANYGRMDKLSSDRSIRDHCECVWHVQPGQCD